MMDAFNNFNNNASSEHDTSNNASSELTMTVLDYLNRIEILTEKGIVTPIEDAIAILLAQCTTWTFEYSQNCITKNRWYDIAPPVWALTEMLKIAPVEIQNLTWKDNDESKTTWTVNKFRDILDLINPKMKTGSDILKLEE